MITLHVFLVRQPSMSHDEFLRYWHEVHGPFIRSTPALAERLLRYEQHPRLPGPKGGDADFDGVAVQSFASWADFTAFISGPAGEAMRADELNFLDRDRLRVVITSEPNVVVP